MPASNSTVSILHFPNLERCFIPTCQNFCGGPLGEFVSSREHLEQSLALYDPQQHHSLAFLYGGADPGMLCLSQATWTLWMLGHPDQALQRNHEVLTLAQKLSHPHSLAFALGHAAALHQFRREAQAAQERAEAVITLSTEQGFPYWLAWGTILRGWALAEQGEAEEGSAQICQGLAAYRAPGGELRRPHFFTFLAEAYEKKGQVEEGLTVLAEALTLMNNTGERYWEAELWRLKGTLTLQSKTSLGQVSGKSQASQNKSKDTNSQSLTLNTRAEAEACFLKALDVARKQQAKSLELRAATSLARLWQQQDKKAEARALLAPVYQWFTEGFDTADLQDAKALLDELA